MLLPKFLSRKISQEKSLDFCLKNWSCDRRNRAKLPDTQPHLKASVSTTASDTIVTPYRYRSTNPFVSLLKIDEIDMSIFIQPQSRKNEISDISPGQKCVIQMEISIREFRAHGGMERREVLKRYCGWQNKATLLKQAPADRTLFAQLARYIKERETFKEY